MDNLRAAAQTAVEVWMADWEGGPPPAVYRAMANLADALERPAADELALLRRLHAAANEQMASEPCAALEDAMAALADAGYHPPEGSC